MKGVLNMNDMKKGMLLFILMFILLFLVSCSSSEDELAKDKNVLEDKIGECDKEVKIIKAYGDDIRIRYALGQESEADEVAREWCDVNGKVSVKGVVSCQGCCYTSYMCKQ